MTMREHRFVVGYEGEGQCVYGMHAYRTWFGLKEDNPPTGHFAELLTLWQAKRALKELKDPSGKPVIFELVPVEDEK